MIANTNRTLAQIVAAQLIEEAQRRAQTRATSQMVACPDCEGTGHVDALYCRSCKPWGECGGGCTRTVTCERCDGGGELPACDECGEAASFDCETCSECMDAYEARVRSERGGK